MKPAQFVTLIRNEVDSACQDLSQLHGPAGYWSSVQMSLGEIGDYCDQLADALSAEQLGDAAADAVPLTREAALLRAIQSAVDSLNIVLATADYLEKSTEKVVKSDLVSKVRDTLSSAL